MANKLKEIKQRQFIRFAPKAMIYVIIISLFLKVSYADTASVILQDADTENLADSRVSKISGRQDINFGTSPDMHTAEYTSNFERERIYLRFNIEEIIESGITVSEAYLYLTPRYADSYFFDYVHEVYSNVSWDEDTITWNNQPCDVNQAFSGNINKCNITSAASVNVTTANVTYKWNITSMVKNAVETSKNNVSMILRYLESGNSNGYQHIYRTKEAIDNTSLTPYLNITYASSDSILSNITFYNLTSDGGLGCTNWNTNKSYPCQTNDLTPTVQINTAKNAHCAIGVTNSNYSVLGTSRVCDGAGTKSHTCTLITDDQFVQYSGFLYIGCKPASGTQNTSSTSGALAVTLIGLEEAGRGAIEQGIENALLDDYSIKSDIKIYARKMNNSQAVGSFDKIARWTNKIWGFNIITGNDIYANLFNITPVLYTREFVNTSNAQITYQVELLINLTK